MDETLRYDETADEMAYVDAARLRRLLDYVASTLDIPTPAESAAKWAVYGYGEASDLRLARTVALDLHAGEEY